MAKPTKSYQWATDATYDADAANNKVEPPSILRSNGYERGEEPGAQHWNYHLNALAEWQTYFDGVIDGTVDTNGVSRTLEFHHYDFAENFTSAGVAQWYAASQTGKRSRVDQGLTFINLTRRLPRGCTITALQVDVDPGIGRNTTSRMGIELTHLTPDWAPAADAVAVLQTVYDNTSGGAPGTHPRQLISLTATSLPLVVDPAKVLVLTVFAGSDGATNTDLFNKMRVTITDVRAA